MNPNAFHKISYGLFVLTSADGDKQNGCIINTFPATSSSPIKKQSAYANCFSQYFVIFLQLLPLQYHP